MLVPKTEDTLIKKNEDIHEDYIVLDVDENQYNDYRLLYIDITEGDEKAIEDYIKYIEKLVRKSFEYNQYIFICKTEFDLNKCAFFKNINFEESRKISLEMHHYPLTLYDIVSIIVSDRMKKSSENPGNMTYYNNLLNPFDIAKEVMKCHYEGIIGLVPMSLTPHELYHQGKLFIPLTKDYVFGNYNAFIKKYNVMEIDNFKEKLGFINSKTKDLMEGGLELNLEKLTIKEVYVNMQNTEKMKKIEIKEESEEEDTKE